MAVFGRRLGFAKGGIHNMGGYHDGGSPIMERIAITSQYDIEARKKSVRYIAGMNAGDREALTPKNRK